MKTTTTAPSHKPKLVTPNKNTSLPPDSDSTDRLTKLAFYFFAGLLGLALLYFLLLPLFL